MSLERPEQEQTSGHEKPPPLPPTPEEIAEAGPRQGSIIASIGPDTAFDAEKRKLLENRFREAPGMEKVDIADQEAVQHKRGQRSIDQDYVISTISPTDKYSVGYANCIGISVVGIDKQTGENVSILVHAFPSRCIEDSAKQYEADLAAALDELRERVEPGTLDAVLFGGSALDQANDDAPRKMTYAEEYQIAAGQAARVVRQELGIDPHVALAPQGEGPSLSALFETQKRRLHVLGEKGGTPNPIEQKTNL